MKRFKSRLKQGLAVLLSSTILFGDIGVYATDLLVSSGDILINNKTIESNSSTFENTIENTELVSTNSLDEFSEEITSLILEDSESNNTYVTKRLIVLSNTSEFDVYGADVLSYDNLYILSYETEEDCKYAYENLLSNTNIISVEIDSIMETESNTISNEVIEISTKDTDFNNYLKSLIPSTEVKVAILDTGIDISKFNNVIDLGINLSSSGKENSIMDDNGHGTEMATIITNNTNNNVKLMPIKIANSEGKATVLNTYLGIKYAIENDADIINISMNAVVSSQSQILTNIIDEATKKGIYVVVSAGNNSTMTSNTTPANIESAIVISAVNESNSFAEYSNYGSTIDYSASGVYLNKTGTSYAAANVSAYIATMLSANESIDILNNYAIDLGVEGKDNYYGNGYLGLTQFVNLSNNIIEDGTCVEDILTVDATITSSMYYVLMGDNSFDITSNFTNITYNTNVFDCTYVSSSPEFDINTPGQYKVTYRFDAKSEDVPFTGQTTTRIIEVTDDEEFIEDYYSLNVSATQQVVKTGRGNVYTAYSYKYTSYPQAFYGTAGYYPTNLRTINAARAIESINVAVNSGILTWTNVIDYARRYIDDVTVGTDLQSRIDSSGLTIHECLIGLFYYGNKNYSTSIDYSTKTSYGETGTNSADKATMSGETIRYENIYSTNFKSSIWTTEDSNGYTYADRIKNAIHKAGKAYIEVGPILREKNAYSSLTTTEQSYFTEEMFWDMKMLYYAYAYSMNVSNFNSKLSRTNWTEAMGVKYGSDIKTITLDNSGYSLRPGKYNGDDDALTADILADQNAGGSWGSKQKIVSLRLFKGDTIEFYMLGKSCNHAGVLARVLYAYDPSEYPTISDCDDEAIVGSILNIKTDETDGESIQSQTVAFTASEDGYYTFAAQGTAYSCRLAEIYVYTEGEYSLKATTYTINLDNQSATTSGTTVYYEKYNYGNYETQDATTSISKIEVPTKTGYTFGGYYTGTNGSGTQYIDSNGNILSCIDTDNDGFVENQIGKDTTLYAKWTIHKSTLKVNPNGGNWNSFTSSKTYEQNYNTTLSIPKPTITNYTATFNGNGGTSASSSITTNKAFSTWTRTNTYGTMSSLTSAATYTFGPTNNVTDTLTATYSGSYTITLPSASRTGYTFNGWYTAASGGTKIGDAGATITLSSNVTYYAQWTIHKSTLKVDPNGGNWNNFTTTQSYTQNYNTTLSIPKPTITNYTATFNGNGGTSASSSKTTNKAFSTWTRTNTYGTMNSLTSAATYTFGSTNNVTDTLTATYSGSYTITLPSASRDNYGFNGWYTAASGGTKIGDAGDSVTLSSNVTYYAQWIANTYTLTINPDGGSYIDENGNIISTIRKHTFYGNQSYIAVSSKSETEGVTSPESDTGLQAGYYISKPTKVGYTFNGWYYGTTSLSIYKFGGGSMYGMKNPYQDITVNAKWTIHSSTLKVNPNGGTWDEYTATQSYTQNYNTTLSIPKPTITNYTATFNGNGGTSASSNKITNKAFSKWTRTNTYGTMSSLTSAATYTFGSTNNVTDTLTATYSGSYTITLPSASRTGYTFNGWYTAASGGTKIGDAGATVTLSSNVTYYAQWTANTYILTINPDGGKMYYNNSSTTTSSFDIKFLYGSYRHLGTFPGSYYSYNKTVGLPLKTGYTFNGWKVTSGGGTVTYYASPGTYGYKTDDFSGNQSTTSSWAYYLFNGNYAGNVTITAQWTINKYTVTYIDVIDSISGEELGRTTKQVNYNSIVKGSDIGSVTTDNYYYKGYYYDSCTSSTVTTSGATVYRIFKLKTNDISGNIIWDDWNNKNSSRPDNVILHIIGSDGNTYDYEISGDNSQNTNTNEWPYSKAVPKYDSNGNVITYTVSQDKAISKEEGIIYKVPIVNGYDITNEANSNPDEVEPEINVTVYVEWVDNNNEHSYRPNDITIQLLQNGVTIKEATTSEIEYTFENLYKYDENGNAYEYTITSNEVDRYSLNIDNEYYTLTYTFQSPTFSVTIPKTVVLDGQTGIGEYTVSVKGNIDDRDYVKVIPDSSFIMRNDFLSDIIAIVKQTITSFTNKNGIKEGTTTQGTITTKSLAGEWSGSFNFNIYFEFGE